MSFHKKTIKDVNIRGKTVLVRADYNVPLDEHLRITSDFRITQSLPTIEYLLEHDCKVVIISHLGRPKGRETHVSLAPIAKRLSELINKPIQFVHKSIGDDVVEAVSSAKPRDILLLENLRYHDEEESNGADFAKQLASLADIFVQDGFGVVHRAHASTDAITRFIPSVAGLLLRSEVDTITKAMDEPRKPLMAIIGGAKIAEKLDILERFIDIADIVAVGGAMANTFLLAEGINIGKSLADKDDIPLAKDIIERSRRKAKKQSFVFYLPQDGVVATKIDTHTRTRIVDWDAHVVATIESYPKRPPKSSASVQDDERILDIGPFSGAFIAGSMQLANTVIWNGTMGVTETPAPHDPVGPFANGTELIVDALSGEFGHKPYSVVGGGDTVSYLEQRKLTKIFNHVSTGGGASLELMSGKKLPGVEALLDK
jgi:phosphoglycerate kinase